MNDFIMHFDPGARGDFLYHFLRDTLKARLKSNNSPGKLHTLFDLISLEVDVREIPMLSEILKNNHRIKIRINSLQNIPQVVFNNMLKNTNMADDIYHVGIGMLNYNLEIIKHDYLYDYVIPVNMLDDANTLAHIYTEINGRESPKMDTVVGNLARQIKWTSCEDANKLEQLHKLNKISQNIDGDLSAKFIKNRR